MKEQQYSAISLILSRNLDWAGISKLSPPFTAIQASWPGNETSRSRRLPHQPLQVPGRLSISRSHVIESLAISDKLFGK